MNIESLTTGIWKFSHPDLKNANIWYFSLDGNLHFSRTAQDNIFGSVPWKVSNDTIYIDFMSRQFLIVARLKDLNNLEGFVYRNDGELNCERFQATKIAKLNPYILNDYFRHHGPYSWDLKCLGHGISYVVKFVGSSEVKMYDKGEYDKEDFEFPDIESEIEFQAGTYVIYELKLIIKLLNWEQYPLIFYYEHPRKFTGHFPLWEGEYFRYYAGTLQEYQNHLQQT